MAAICHYCSATMIFVKLDSGKPIPCDPIPDDTGTVAAVRRAHAWVGYVVSRAKPWKPGYTLFRAHRASCKPDQPRVTFSEHRATTERAPALFGS